MAPRPGTLRATLDLPSAGRSAAAARHLLAQLLVAWAAESFRDLDADVRQSIARITSSPFIPHKDSVRGFVYEVESGKLREVS